MKKLVSLLMILCLVFSMAACTNQEKPEEKTQNDKKVEDVKEEPIAEKKEETKEESSNYLKFTDSYGAEIVLEKEPTKVVSIAPSITETIFALGAQDKLVGRTDFCDYPQEVSEIASVGGLKDPNIEKIVEISPDVVIVSTHFDPEVKSKLEEAGIKVVGVYGEKNFEGVYSVIETVGNIVGKTDEAKDMVADMKTRVEAVKTKVKDAEKVLTYYVVGAGEYGDFTAPKDSFINDIIEIAGGENAGADAEGWKYSVEKIVEKDPQVMICSNFNPSATVSELEGYKALTAVKEGKIYDIDSNTVDRQGPRVIEGLEIFAKLMHPELYEQN